MSRDNLSAVTISISAAPAAARSLLLDSLPYDRRTISFPRGGRPALLFAERRSGFLLVNNRTYRSIVISICLLNVPGMVWSLLFGASRVVYEIGLYLFRDVSLFYFCDDCQESFAVWYSDTYLQNMSHFFINGGFY